MKFILFLSLISVFTPKTYGIECQWWQTKVREHNVSEHQRNESLVSKHQRKEQSYLVGI